MFELSLIYVSFGIGVAIIYLLRRYDSHEKEPIPYMVAVTIWGGAWAVGISLFLYQYLATFGVADLNNTYGAMFVIGPVEEFSKLVALAVSYPIFRKHFNEPTDGLVYMACVALGFSLIENYFYVSSSDHPLTLLATRTLLTTPMHISFSIFMGLAFYMLVFYRIGWVALLIAFLYAVVTHGLFDLIIFNGYSLIVLLILIKLAHMWTIKLLGYTNSISPFKQSLKEFVDTYSSPTVEEGIECLNCGNIETKKTFKSGKVFFQYCPACEKYITRKDAIIPIFNRFGSTFKNAKHDYIIGTDKENGYSTLYDGNYISDKKNLAFFDLKEFSEVLEKLTRNAQEGMLDIVQHYFSHRKFK